MKRYKDFLIVGIDHGYGNIKTANTVTPTGISKSDFPSASRPIMVSKMFPFLICGCERFSVRIRLAFLTRFDLPSTCPTSDNPLGVISLSFLTTYSIFRIFKFTLRVLFVQRFLCFYFTTFTLFCTVADVSVLRNQVSEKQAVEKEGIEKS